MLNTRSSLLSCLVLLVAFPSSPSYGANAVQTVDLSPTGPLAVSTWSDKRIYRVGDVIRITFRLKNRSDNLLFIPQELVPVPPSYLGFEVQLLDRFGREPESGLAQDGLFLRTPAAKTIRESSLVLVPGAFYGAEHRIHTGTYRKLKPGRYRIQVSYRSWNAKRAQKEDLDVLAPVRYRVVVGRQELNPVWVELR